MYRLDLREIGRIPVMGPQNRPATVRWDSHD